jgi:hypothetical protein
LFVCLSNIKNKHQIFSLTWIIIQWIRQHLKSGANFEKKKKKKRKLIFSRR